MRRPWYIVPAVDPAQPQRPVVAFLRRTIPWLVAAAILVALALRIPFAAFRDAVTHGPHAQLALADLVITLFQLGTDTFATWVALVALGMRRPASKIFVVRAATNVLTLLNYALGQGAFGYYLHKTGVPSLRAAGATLFLMGTNFAMLLVVTAGAWLAAGQGADAAMWWTLVVANASFALYLVVIALSPGFLARRQLLAPLFETGLRGHLLALLARLPHTLAVMLTIWIAMRAWNLPVPFWAGMIPMPIVVIASVLPIAPAGLGTTQAAFVYFYAAFAPGATADDRAASILAFSIVHFVYAWLASIALGLVCAPAAKRASA